MVKRRRSDERNSTTSFLDVLEWLNFCEGQGVQWPMAVLLKRRYNGWSLMSPAGPTEGLWFHASGSPVGICPAARTLPFL